MSLLVIIIHVIVCIALILIVLLQTGKGADMGAAFGGGASQTLFGTTGASTFLSKATTAAAVIFMLTSLVLAYMASDRPSGSLMPDNPASLEQEQPTGEEDTPAATSESGKSEDSAADVKPDVQPGTTEEQPAEPAPAPPAETTDNQQDNQQ